MKVGWEADTLGEVCELIARGVAPNYVDTGGILVLNQKCVRDHRVSPDFGRRHDDSSRAVRPDRLLKFGDVLVNSTGTGTLGRVAQIRIEPVQPMTVDTHVTIVRPCPGKFHPDFFGYMMVQIEDQLAASGEGASGQTELARSTLAGKFQVSYPTSLDEQRRIVAVLDKAFAGIATATANAQKNLTNARALFESELDAEIVQVQAKFSGKALSDACERITVGHVGPMKTRYLASGIPFLRSQNVRPFKLALDNVLYIDEAFDAELKKSRLQAGDVAVVRTGYPGTAAVIPESLSTANCADLVIIRPSSALNPHYLAALLNSNTGKASVAGKLNGAAQKHFNVGAAKKMKVAIPSLTEQQRIVDRIELIDQKSRTLHTVHQSKLAALSELKQSLLQKAFAGELT